MNTMYRLYIDDVLMNEPLNAERTNAKNTLVSGTVSETIGNASSCDFSIPLGHEHYNLGTLMTSNVTVYENDEMIFYGRITEISYDFHNTKSYYCEGALAFLNDTVQQDEVIDKIGVADLFRKIIANHNLIMPNSRQLEIGNINIDNRPLYEVDLTRQMSYSMLQSKCINVESGYLYVTNGRTVNWVKSIGRTAETSISFGLNLLDITQNINVSDIKTVVVGTGQLVSFDEEGNEVREEIVTVVESEAVNTYGKIYTVEDFGDFTEEQQLGKVAKTWIELQQENTMSIDVTEAEIYPLNNQYTPIRIAEKVNIYSDYHVIIATLPVTKINHDLASAEKTLSLGGYNANNKDLSTKINNKNKKDGSAGGYDPEYDEEPAISIYISQEPARKEYMVGETYDFHDLVVMATYEDGSEEDITMNCSINPPDGSTVMMESQGAYQETRIVEVTYGSFSDSFSVLVTRVKLNELVITNPANKQAYYSGELIDYTGLVVTAKFSDGTEQEVTNTCVYTPMQGIAAARDVFYNYNPETGYATVEIEYTHDQDTLKIYFDVLFIMFIGITIQNPPNKLSYTIGEPIDYTGLVVHANYSDQESIDVTNKCTIDPLNGTALWESGSVTVKVTYEGAEVTFNVTVNGSPSDIGTFDLKYVNYNIAGSVIIIYSLKVDNIIADNLDTLNIPNNYTYEGTRYSVAIG